MATPIPANRCGFSAGEVLRATGGAFNGDPEGRFEGVSVDSRTVGPGNLFVALRGVRDGHEFLGAAAARGATAAIVERGRSDGAIACFEVEEPLAALGALAQFHLRRMRAVHRVPTIAIGGAAGKTSTKELTAALAGALFGEILATPGNLNNLIGVPMTILTLTDRHRAAVLECGTNQRGEIARLAAIVAADVALVLNVDVEHTEGLGSLEGVADEEAELFRTARVAIVGTAEPMLLARIPAGMATVKFGAAADADVRLASRVVVTPGRQRIAIALGSALTARGVDSIFEGNLGLIGAASAMNAAAALAAVTAAVARPLLRTELAALSRALAEVRPVAGRLATREIGGVVVIDDSYNANPRSVRVALEAARETADGLQARLIVALGDMLELGALAPAMHSEAIRDLYKVHPEAAIAVGPEYAAAVHAVTGAAADFDSDPSTRHAPSPAAPSTITEPAPPRSPHSVGNVTKDDTLGVEGGAHRPPIHLAPDSAAAATIVRGLIHPGDVLLVKGSRGIAMERIIYGLAR